MIKTDTFEQNNKKINKSSKAITMNLKDTKYMPYKYDKLQEREK
jgi:hypothetical protein